jgi:hypothetical protein
MLVFHCNYCGFEFSNNGGPFVWVQPQCSNCGSNQVSIRDLPTQPEYTYDQLLEWAEIGRQALADEGEFVERPEEAEEPEEISQIRAESITGIPERVKKREQ